MQKTEDLDAFGVPRLGRDAVPAAKVPLVEEPVRYDEEEQTGDVEEDGVVLGRGREREYVGDTLSQDICAGRICQVIGDEGGNIQEVSRMLVEVVLEGIWHDEVLRSKLHEVTIPQLSIAPFRWPQAGFLRGKGLRPGLARKDLDPG